MNNKDYTDEMRKLIALAEQGDIDSQYSLGVHYYNAADFRQAVRWYTAAAE